MRKLLIPSIVMVTLYLTIQLVAFIVQNSKKDLPFDESAKSIQLIKMDKPIADKIKLPKQKKKQTIFTTNNQTHFRRKKQKIDQVIDLSQLPSRVKVFFENFKESANKSIEIIYERTGTKITIPANAFVSQSGDPVNGNIEIKYREFIKPSEIFTSGIPMHWKGEEYLESAGMFQIEAWQNGKKLELAPNMEIEIAMTSSFTDQDYNLYAFNDDNQNWTYANNNFSYNESALQNKVDDDDWRLISNDSLPQYVNVKMDYYVAIANVIGFTPDYEDALHKRENTIYRQTSVKLQYDEKLFPDLESLGKYNYKIYTHNYSELEKIANTLMNKETSLSMGWKDLLIRYPGKLGLVDLNFINDMDTFTLGAEPIIENMSEKKQYLKDYYQYAAIYEQSRMGRLSIKRSKMVKKKVDFEKDTLIVQELKRMKMAEKVERKFLVGKLMTWNCDRPFPIRPWEAYMVNIISDQVSNISMVYAAIPGKNSVFKATDFKNFALVDKGNMYLWIMIDENTIGYITPAMLKDRKWDKLNVNDLEMKTMSLDAFLPILDREILSSSEKLTEIL